MSTGDGFGYSWGKKRRVLCSSSQCHKDCCHSGLLYASLIGCNSRRLKGQRWSARSWQIQQSIRRPTSSFVLLPSYVRTTQLGDRSFAVAAPRAWNNLPSTLRRVDNTLKRQLKTFLCPGVLSFFDSLAFAYCYCCVSRTYVAVILNFWFDLIWHYRSCIASHSR